MSLQTVFTRMEDNIVKNTEEVDGVRSHVGFTVFRHRGHKLIVGNGFVWDAQEEKLYGDPSPALHWFGGDEENDPDVRKHYCDILRFVRGGEKQTDCGGDSVIYKRGVWELEEHENGSAELVYEDEDSAPWTVAYVNQWGYISTTDYKFLMLPIGSETKQTEREELLRKLDDLGYTEDEVRRILSP